MWSLPVLWVLFIFSLCLALLFFLKSERLRDKLLKTEDSLLQLANKENFFNKKKSLIRDDELSFYSILYSIVKDNYYLFPQVHLSELVDVKNNVRDHDNLYQLLGNKSVDYVILNKPDMSPLLAIELNGESHFMANRQNRDKVVSLLLEKAGIKFLAVDKNNYNLEELRTGILSMI